MPRLSKNNKEECQSRLNQGLLEMGTRGETLTWEKLQEVIEEAAKELSHTPNCTQERELLKNIREMLLKREALKHTPKTIRNKVKFNLCCKLVKKMLENITCKK